LWSRGTDTLAKIARILGDQQTAEAAERARERAVAAFKDRFWCHQTHYAFDCVSETADVNTAWADPTIRPNALIALAVDPELFDPEQRVQIVRRAKEELLTPRGVRTLSPDHSDYQGHFPSVPEDVVGAYHQGTVWPYLVGFYARARASAQPDEPLATELAQLVRSCMAEAPVLGHVPQVADGDHPNRARGCPAQAFSVGELLATLTELGIP
jgi:glycogen debranching enzyme